MCSAGQWSSCSECVTDFLSFVRLSVTENRIGDTGAKALSEGVANNTVLQTLGLLGRWVLGEYVFAVHSVGTTLMFPIFVPRGGMGLIVVALFVYKQQNHETFMKVHRTFAMLVIRFTWV